MQHSYIGQKGYTIAKSSLTEEELSSLKEELTLSPKEGFSIKKPNKSNVPRIPVYRENSEKIYVPRFFGETKYGVPDKSKLSDGDPIDVPFTQSLRDYQTDIVNCYTDHVMKHKHGGGGILEVPCGRGKCLGRDTEILMYDGTVKYVQDVEIGDVLMGDDSTPRNVLSLARGREQMYRVCSKKGDGYVVNESHILSLKYSSNMNKRTKKGDVLDISVNDYLNLPKYYHGRGGPLVGYRVPIEFPEKEVPFDPYVVGYWLGDGMSYHSAFSTQESAVLLHMHRILRKKHPTLYIRYSGQQYDYRINSSLKRNKECNEFLNFLRDANLLKNKHIPDVYKCNSREIRLQLLAGILDADGSYHENCYDLIQKSERLLDEIIYLARSLGFAAFKTECTKTCTNGKNGPVSGTYYRTNIYGSGLEEIPTQCKRKKAHPRKLIRDARNYRIHLEKLEVDDYFGFEIDGNRRFVLGDFSVTHNTIMSLNIIHRIQTKTIILVHKEFLMNQWIERIRDFLPTARVGIIQAGKFEIENKDIVIGMIQTLYSRDYPMNTFSSFGLTVIDEVHRIGSEEFSKTLTKVVTKYMLGISATVERKDGLTDILYMYIGPKVYEEERKDEDVVQVRAIHYEDPNNIEFNTVEYDFRGNVKYSTMVSRISDHLPRCEFLVQVLQDLVTEDDSKQIMVLSHKRDLLAYIHDEVETKQIASCGFYVGGMKQAQLQATESKHIVLATYAMAAEALDIKTLNTLVMVSPKTDVIQSVGRILRTRGDGKIIVDIVDPHDVFQNQWKKRRTFYNKSNYQIRVIKHEDYDGMEMDPTKWKLYQARRKKGDKDSDEEKPKCLIAIESTR
jgi:superfamily II DNA or RNA helicase